MDPRIELITRLGQIEVWSVDGEKVREVEPDFTNFGQHFRWPDLIPDNEWWISDEVNRSELPFFIDHLKTEWVEMEFGASYQEALSRADKLEQAARAKSAKGRSLDAQGSPDADRAHLRVLGRHGDATVWEVDGEVVRDLWDVDFVEGGHGYVYDFIPQDEIWVEQAVALWVLHETHEYDDMKQGMTYDEAHQRALEVEMDARHRQGTESVVASLITRVREGEHPEDVVRELTTTGAIATLPAPMLVKDKKDGTTKPGYPYVKTTRKDEAKDWTAVIRFKSDQAKREFFKRFTASGDHKEWELERQSDGSYNVYGQDSVDAALSTAYEVSGTSIVSDPYESIDALLHPNGRCTCCGEGQCEWCKLYEIGGSGSHSDYHTGAWTFGVGGPDRGGNYRDMRAATRGGLDSPDDEPGSQPPTDWPDQWTQGAKKLNIAYNKEESLKAVEAVCAGMSCDEALNLQEAGPWVATEYKDISQAIKMSVQARAVKHNWKIVKQSADYALAVSAWGPRREFKVVRQGSALSKGTVMTRLLDPSDPA